MTGKANVKWNIFSVLSSNETDVIHWLVSLSLLLKFGKRKLIYFQQHCPQCLCVSIPRNSSYCGKKPARKHSIMQPLLLFVLRCVIVSVDHLRHTPFIAVTWMQFLNVLLIHHFQHRHHLLPQPQQQQKMRIVRLIVSLHQQKFFLKMEN